MHALVEAGADVLELGVPFSDPMADGPVIQRAADAPSRRAWAWLACWSWGRVPSARHGHARRAMGYANPIERMGQADPPAAPKRPADGVLVVDYPPEEVVEFAGMLDQHGIAPIFLLAPTSTEPRIKAIANVARGYVYCLAQGRDRRGFLNTQDVLNAWR